uniref:Uncharacterized protein n=1 Tax=Arundo donax TaxID=35708 RepID=A0A0A8Y9F7_ARUDO
METLSKGRTAFRDITNNIAASDEARRNREEKNRKQREYLSQTNGNECKDNIH